MDGSKLIKPLPFSQLNFRFPYTEKWLCDEKTTVFFNGVAKKSGLVVLKYRNILNKQFIRISCSVNDMYSNALMLNSFMKKIDATDVCYAFIPAGPEKHLGLKKSLWLGYLQEPIDNSFDLVKPWLESSDQKFPLDKLTLFNPFSFNEEGERSWNFYDLRDRPGIYLIIEDGIVVRVGQTGKLHNRPRTYFYPAYKDRQTKHYRVSYYDRMLNNEHMYQMATISLPLGVFKSWRELQKLLDFLEKKATQELCPRDNIKDNPNFEGSDWKPITADVNF